MNMKKIKQVARILIIEYKNTQNIPNNCYLSSATCELLSFSEYLNGLNVQIIQKHFFINLENSEFELLKKIINRCIEKYLNDNIKTLAIY